MAPPKKKVVKVPPKPHDSESETESVVEYPGEQVSQPDGYAKLFAKDVRKYKSLFQCKSVMDDTARVLTGYHCISRRFFPESHALMTSAKGPLLPCFRRDLPDDEDLEQYIFHEMCRLQGSLGLSKEG